jgi:hypothetical protein
MQPPSRVCCHFGRDTFLLADDSYKEGELEEKRKQRYWSAFQSVLTVLLTVLLTVMCVSVSGSCDTADAKGGCVKQAMSAWHHL